MTTRIIHGDARDVLPTLPPNSVHAVVTSPPYFGLRDYGVIGQIGLEASPADYIATMVAVFREVKRVLRDDGTLWLNMGDSYSSGTGGDRNSGTVVQGAGYLQKSPARASVGSKPKDLMMMPARLAIALQDDGWWLRSMLPWVKRCAMPESVTDRPASAVEYVFLLTKSPRYYYDNDAVRKEPSGRTDPITLFGHVPDRMDGNSNGYALDGLKGRNFRNSDLFFDSLQDQPEPAPRMRRVKIPGGWDTGAGAHATVHRNGRTSAEYQEQLAPVADRGSSPEPLALIADADGQPLALDVNPAAFSGVVTYGTCRIASPDCSIHDYQDARALALEYDAQQAASPTGRSPDNDAHPAQWQDAAVVAIALDRPASPFDAISASGHSIWTSRSDLPLARDEIFYGIPPARTECIELASRSVAKFVRRRESSTSVDALPDAPRSDPSAQNQRRIVGTVTFGPRSSGCTCHHAGKVEKRQDHFACFPPKLVEPLIRAGTSERGCCAQCGAPWVRMTDASYIKPRGESVIGGKKGCDASNNWSGMPILSRVTSTTGWQPSCQCIIQCQRMGCRSSGNAPPLVGGICAKCATQQGVVPCTVLDPFAGAGTTLLVADRLQRDAIGIELSPAYAAMARNRLMDDAPLLARMEAAD